MTPMESYLVPIISQLLEMILPDLYLGVLRPTGFKEESFKRKRVVSCAKAVEHPRI